MEGYVKTEQAATMLKKSPRTVRRYIDKGALEAVFDDNGDYWVSVDSIAHHMARAAPAADDETDWNAERAKQDALYKQLNVALKQLELDERLGLLHRAEHVREAFADLIYAQRSAMASLSGKLAPILAGETDEAVIAARIDDEVRAIQEDLARHEYDPEFYRKRLAEEQGKVVLDDG